MKPIIISGGPGAGKTTLINALAERGYQTHTESSRQLIEQQSQLEHGILPWTNLAGFAELCLEVMGKQKQAAIDSNSLSFMDRAIPDICAYLKQGKLDVSERFVQGCCDYHPHVFLCKPEFSIYVQDDVRPYPFEEAIDIHNQLHDTYVELGFEVVDVPWGSVEQRVNFIENEL
ncbi:AAA family ATPase [Vibrio sp. ZSDE26]|uniref:AAA family ATPase n=1 Tax=Vibrio amylolyticus TaxID=2847292 RepID=A0A9X2BGX6_9VIBR|nr:AAA family ATPase [Vibrio amylolyticus]MCK6263331.1 AAA family ATPase [Vibrio amylolyticus]